MSLTDKVAERMAKNISPSDIVNKVGELFREQIACIVQSDLRPAIRQYIAEYLASGDFKGFYHLAIKEELREHIDTYAPVLIIDASTEEGRKEFDQLAAKYVLDGPLGTVSSVKKGSIKAESYLQALIDLTSQARATGVNLVRLHTVETELNTYNGHVLQVIGYTYINMMKEA